MLFIQGIKIKLPYKNIEITLARLMYSQFSHSIPYWFNFIVWKCQKYFYIFDNILIKD